MGGSAAALLALLLLTYASALSNVMQVQMALTGAMAATCDALPGVHPMANRAASDVGVGMPGMAMSGMRLDHAATSAPAHADPKSSKGHHAACPFCASAAHAPILGGATPLRRVTTFIFTAFRVVASLGPRGPPAFAPKAQGPPPLL